MAFILYAIAMSRTLPPGTMLESEFRTDAHVSIRPKLFAMLSRVSDKAWGPTTSLAYVGVPGLTTTSHAVGRAGAHAVQLRVDCDPSTNLDNAET